MSQSHQLLLIEGIPGSGKTTFITTLSKELENKAATIQQYTEDDLHPVNLLSCAYLSKQEYTSFMHAYKKVWSSQLATKSFEELENQILCATQFEEHHAIVAYKKIPFPNSSYNEIIRDLRAHEIYNGALPLNEFKKLHCTRWERFCMRAMSDPDAITIFQDALLQIPIMELVCVYDCCFEMIADYVARLLDCVTPLRPKLYYILPTNLTQSLLGCRNDSSNLLEQMVHHNQISNYGKLHDLKGFSGLINFYNYRLSLDHILLHTLDIPYELIASKINPNKENYNIFKIFD